MSTIRIGPDVPHGEEVGPRLKEFKYRWPWVYAHGEAINILRKYSRRHSTFDDINFGPSDIIKCNYPLPSCSNIGGLYKWKATLVGPTGEEYPATVFYHRAYEEPIAGRPPGTVRMFGRHYGLVILDSDSESLADLDEHLLEAVGISLPTTTISVQPYTS